MNDQTRREHCLIRALRRQPVSRTPLWIMRQAGRYLPEYREMRARIGSFLTLCKTPDHACELTLQPIRRFPLDAAILFSDILVIPDAMGLGLRFVEGRGPVLDNPLRDMADVRRLPVPDPEIELSYVMEAARLTRRELRERVPLIGFSGSPWTLAAYMVQGQGGGDFPRLRTLIRESPELAHRLLATLARAVTDYLNAQAAAGVQVLMLFDTWGGLLDQSRYREYSLAYLQRVIEGLRVRNGPDPVPVIIYGRGGCPYLEDIAASGCDAVGLDWTCGLGAARRRVGQRVSLQGNMDPAVLLASPEAVRREAARILEDYGAGEGHVFNLGHGILPDTDPECVAALIAAVREFSRPLHGAAPVASGAASGT